jgi:hypothetical protein
MMYEKECVNLMHIILRAKDFEKDGNKMCLNIYDIRLTDTFPQCGMNWPPEIHAITKFLDVCALLLILRNFGRSSYYTAARRGVVTACKSSFRQLGRMQKLGSYLLPNV